MSFTHRQAELLAFIGRFQADNNGVSPSFQEMMEELGLKSKAGVHRLITALVERGRLTRRENRARALEIVPNANDLERFPTSILIAELARRSEDNRRAA